MSIVGPPLGAQQTCRWFPPISALDPSETSGALNAGPELSSNPFPRPRLKFEEPLGVQVSHLLLVIRTDPQIFEEALAGTRQEGRDQKSALNWLSGPTPRLDAFSQEEVFEDKLSFPRRQRTTASATDYLAVVCLRTGFDFDDLIECLAV